VAHQPSGVQRAAKRSRSDPDASLSRAPGVQYRYSLSLSSPSDARGIFQLVDELGAAVRYLVLVQDGAPKRYRAYLGLGSSDLFDLPLRLAARGIHIDHGEQMSNGPGAPGAVGIGGVRRR
jgi:hypothetical protein